MHYGKPTRWAVSVALGGETLIVQLRYEAPSQVRVRASSLPEGENEQAMGQGVWLLYEL
jgi:hypothetical protein